MAEEKKKKEEKTEFDFGAGKISLGGLLDGIGNLIESIGKITERGEGIISKEGDIKGLGDKVRGVYGFTVRTLAGGESKVETFGNIKKTAKGPIVEEEREPIVDIFDEKDQIIALAELPGISDSDVKTELKGDLLTISAETGKRKYHKETVLPCAVNDSSKEVSFKNGILEIKFNKK